MSKKKKARLKLLLCSLVLMLLVGIKLTTGETVYGKKAETSLSDSTSTLESGEKDQLITDLLDKSDSIEEARAKSARLSREKDLLADGWEVIEKVEAGIIPLENGSEFAFFFGPHTGIGKNMGDARIQRDVANAEIRNPVYPEIVQHIHGSDGTMSSTSNLMWSADLKGDYGIPSHVWKDYGYYKKKLPYNMVAYKLIHTPDGYVPNSNFTRGQMLLETTMVGHRQGYAEVTQSVTNISNETFSNFLLGQTIDTNLGGLDRVNINLIGDKKGVYIESDGYRLDYNFDVPNPPDNWMGGMWLDVFSNMMTSGTEYDSRARLRYLTDVTPGLILPNGSQQIEHYKAFKGFLDPGQEVDERPAGTVVSERIDSAIHMKNLPQTFKTNDTISHNYLIQIKKIEDQELSLVKDADEINVGNPYTVKGQWRDSLANKVNLFYQLDNGQRVQFASNLENTELNKDYPFEWTLPKELLAPGTRKIKVIMVNDSGLETTQELVLVVKNSLTINYVDSDKKVLRPSVIKYGEVGATFEETPLELLPDYQFEKVEGATLNNAGNAEGLYSNTASTIYFIYKEIVKEVSLTVNYIRDDDGTAVQDVETELAIPELKVTNLLIGSPFDAQTYKKEFPGFEYVGIETPVGDKVPGKDFTLTFIYKGTLKLSEVTPDIDFGRAPLIVMNSKDIFPKNPITVEILDTRKSTQNWELMLHLGKEFKNDKGHAFSGEVHFIDKNAANHLISTDKTRVDLRKTEQFGKTAVTWGNKDGVYLKQLPGNRLGDYQGQLVWTLMDGL